MFLLGNECFFHCRKSIYKWILTKGGLAGYYRICPKREPEAAKIGKILRQFMCLCLLKAEHVKLEVARLEAELKYVKVSQGFFVVNIIYSFFTHRAVDVDADVRRRLNKFCIYFVQTWCRRVGPADFSVHGVANKTNNCIER